MNKTLIFLFAFFIIFGTPLLKGQDIENQLFELPDVIFKRLESKDSTEKLYELKIKQPIDHMQASKGYFYQRAFLSHRNINSPVVMSTSGYSQEKSYPTELSNLLKANQISIEHRYFGESCPDSMDYSYLTIEQATADLHKINQLFKNIYKGKWLSTGASKGGATTIFYRYFYPEDVDVSVPYVAPINTEFEEKRIYNFLDTIGSDDCRKKITAFQKRMLKDREKALPLIKMYSEGARLKFTYLQFEEAFEYAVLEYPFAFWQYGISCDDIPSENSSIVKAVEHLMRVSSIDLFSDRDLDYFAPHYYQSASQMGYYSYRTELFKGYLKFLPTSSRPTAAIVPKHIPVSFNGKVLKEINEWLPIKGNYFIYIYGGNDTWTASAVPPSKKTNSLWVFLKGQDHGGAEIVNMTKEQQENVISTLEKWLNLKIDNIFEKK
jgi:hypothetical protein